MAVGVMGGETAQGAAAVTASGARFGWFGLVLKPLEQDKTSTYLCEGCKPRDV